MSEADEPIGFLRWGDASQAPPIVHIHPERDRAHDVGPYGAELCFCKPEVFQGEIGVAVYHRDAVSRRLNLRGRMLAQGGEVWAPWWCTRA